MTAALTDALGIFAYLAGLFCCIYPVLVVVDSVGAWLAHRRAEKAENKIS